MFFDPKNKYSSLEPIRFFEEELMLYNLFFATDKKYVKSRSQKTPQKNVGNITHTSYRREFIELFLLN